jgi:3-oxoacyl-ACP reductase-like protein
MSSEENGMRQYSEYEVDTLIEDLTGAAHEAIEQAAVEAAQTAALASLDREMAALSEAQRLQSENSRLKKSRVKTAVVTGVVCFFGGLAIGAGGIAIMRSF